MSFPRFQMDDGLYRCDLCGLCYNRDEVSESSELVNLGGRAIRIFHHICDNCNSVEVKAKKGEGEK
jgi:hypothetical protein